MGELARPAQPATLVHVSFPRVTATRRLVDRCPTCRRRTRKVAQHEDWYGWQVTCCACGERWQDGERCPRSPERGWRQRSSEQAKRLWREMDKSKEQHD